MADEPRDLETVLADIRSEARTLDRNNASFSIDRVLQFAVDVEKAAEDILTWLSEGDAAVRAGRTVDAIRGRYEQMRRDGHARMRQGKRQYLAAFIPRHANPDNAAARGRRAAQEARESLQQKKAS